MHFDAKLWACGGLAVLAALSGCGSSQTEQVTGDYEIGREPTYYSTSYLWKGGDANRLVITNENARTIESFTLDPFAHVASVPIPHQNVKTGVIGAGNGEYFVTLSDDDYAIVKRDGTVRRSPVELAADIQSVAYEPTMHVLVLTSSFQSMTMLTLDETGEVTGSFVAGGLTAEGKAIGAGAILSDGRLAVVAGETTIVVMDVKATVQQQTIVKSQFEVEGATAMGWINQIPGAANLLLVLDGSRLLVVDSAAGTIIDQKDLTGVEVKGRFRDYYPHVVTQNAGQVAQSVLEVTFAGADGKLATRMLRGSTYPVAQTWLDASTMTFTGLFTPVTGTVFDRIDDEKDSVATIEVYRFSLADPANQIPLDKSEIDADLRVALTPGYLFVQHESVLGRSERRNYGKTPESAFLTGYNLDLLRERYRND
jgi:hypothetical protein